VPSFDIVSRVDLPEVDNAVAAINREIATRFDFKGTSSSIEQADLVVTLRSVSEDRLTALRQVLEEKLVKRKVSLKGLEYGTVEEATQGTVRQTATKVCLPSGETTPAMCLPSGEMETLVMVGRLAKAHAVGSAAVADAA